MDIWFYWDVTHALHGVCNPLSTSRVDELGSVLGLAPGKRVIDLACGVGEFLVRWARRYEIGGVGIDISKYMIARAEARGAQRTPDAQLRFTAQAAQDFETRERFDVSMCVGATWIWGGYPGTLQALRSFAKPGGLIVCGEPYWKQEPAEEYLDADDLTRHQFHTLGGCRDVALEQGLDLVWMAGSTLEEWDRYEMLQTASLERFAQQHPQHPDLPEMRARRKKSDEIYFRWGRNTCGFAIWAFRVPA